MKLTHAPLARSARHPVPGARVLGPSHAATTIVVTLKLRRKACLPEADGRLRLTAQQIDEQYGLDPADLVTVTVTLKAYGLQVVDAQPAARTMRVSGRLPDVERAFGVRLIDYVHPRGMRFRGRSGNIHVPLALRRIIEGVFGLDTRPVVKPRKAVRRRVHPRDADQSWYFPGDLASLYSFPTTGAAGQCVALLEFGGGYFPDDLAAFCAAAQITAAPAVVAKSVDGTPTNAHDGAEGEVMLDVEVVAGAAPGAKIVLYFAAFTEQGWVEALDAVLNDTDSAPSVVSASWGDSEDGASWSLAAIDQVNDALQVAALRGITVCAAAGDDGSDDQVGDGYAHVDFPASSPYVLGVGGTTLFSRGGLLEREVAWKDGDGLRADGGGSTGGGVSVVFELPSWQSTIALTSVNPQALPGRIVPDVAADASPNTGYYTIVDGEPGISGGTSASSPLIASLVACLNAALGSSVGFLNPRLYSLTPAGQPLGAVACRDVTCGDNATAAVGGYAAGAGYDAVSGWGVPVGTTLLEQLRT